MDKANGGRVPDWITNMWALEDRAVALAMKTATEESGLFPSISDSMRGKDLGQVLVFGTGGEDFDTDKFKELWNDPENWKELKFENSFLPQRNYNILDTDDSRI